MMCDEYITCKIWFEICDEEAKCDYVNLICGMHFLMCVIF